MTDRKNIKTMRQFMLQKLLNILGPQIDDKNNADEKKKLKSKANAEMAKLRRGINYLPGDLPELWNYLYVDENNRFASKEQWAVYTAITLFAIHQQSIDLSNPMHIEGKRFGSSVAELVKTDDDEDRILKKLNALVTATDKDGISTHLRMIIKLMTSQDQPIAIDYVDLAEDLFWLQFDDLKISNKVRLKWGSDFYKKREFQKKQSETINKEKKENE